jgi:hypothetical protein
VSLLEGNMHLHGTAEAWIGREFIAILKSVENIGSET